MKCEGCVEETYTYTLCFLNYRIEKNCHYNWLEGHRLETVRRARAVITVGKLKWAPAGIERAAARLEDGGGARRAVRVQCASAARARRDGEREPPSPTAPAREARGTTSSVGTV